MNREESNTSIKWNVIMNFIFTLSTFIFPLVTFPYASRILLPLGTGKVAFATSIVSYFTMVGMLGIPTYGIRACAKVRNDKEKLSKTVQELMVINFIAMGMSLFFYLVAIFLVPRLAEDRILFIINIAVLILNLIGCDWLYKSLEQYRFITIRSVIMKGVAIVLMFLFVKDRTDYPVYAAITVLASVGSYVFNFFNLRKIIDFRLDRDLDLKQHLKPVATFFVMTIATTIYANLDAVMLGFIKGDEAVGYYNAAVNIKNIMVSLVTSFGAVLLPRLSVYIKENRQEEFKKLTATALYFVILISIPLVIYFIIYAQPGIYFLSGSSYQGAVLPMQIMMPTVFFIGLSNLFGIQILVPQDKEIVVVHSVTLGAIVNVISNSILIPILGVSGAAIGTLIAECIVTLYQGYYLREFLSTIFKELSYLKLLVSGMLSGVITFVVFSHIAITNVFIELIFSAGIFAIIYLSFLLLLKEREIQSLLKNMKG